MSVLVIGAEKVEQQVEHITQNLQSITEKPRARLNARARSTWKDLKTSLDTGLIRRTALLRSRFGYKSRTLQHKTESWVRKMLTRMIDIAIDALERVRQKLNPHIPPKRLGRKWDAA